MGHNHAPGNNPKLQISIQPNIGLDGDARQSVIEILNTLLSDEMVLTMKHAAPIGMCMALVFWTCKPFSSNSSTN